MVVRLHVKEGYFPTPPKRVPGEVKGGWYHELRVLKLLQSVIFIHFTAIQQTNIFVLDSTFLK